MNSSSSDQKRLSSQNNSSNQVLKHKQYHECLVTVQPPRWLSRAYIMRSNQGQDLMKYRANLWGSRSSGVPRMMQFLGETKDPGAMIDKFFSM
ncbi:hypothetical protein RIR_jg6015.t1 [Rhizophagus irregularis DAOM 181602=DAOM 197198]|nr:hypothetical protein RIR_jg6015.t1 [Rhizophagus irregularis DAOM 181602=DAOM 197198]